MLPLVTTTATTLKGPTTARVEKATNRNTTHTVKVYVVMFNTPIYRCLYNAALLYCMARLRCIQLSVHNTQNITFTPTRFAWIKCQDDPITTSAMWFMVVLYS